jgi:hypothetical protein
MRIRMSFLTPFASLLALAAGAQVSTAPPPVSFSDGGASVRGAGPMESIFIPPKPRAPFSLMLETEWSRPLATGGTFTLVNQRRIVRDSRGRIYQERWLLVPKGGAIPSRMTVFQITDPDRHTWYNCDPQKETCDLYAYHLSSQTDYKPSLQGSGPLPEGRGFREDFDLGVDTIQGLETHGYREVITYNPGTMGNDQEMTISREFRFSPQLGIDLSSIVDNPQSGRQVFTVKELTTSEPDPAIFEVPGDYRIVDRRKEKP